MSPARKLEIAAGTGHFVHLEKPTAVNRVIVDWAYGAVVVVMAGAGAHIALARLGR